MDLKKLRVRINDILEKEINEYVLQWFEEVREDNNDTPGTLDLPCFECGIKADHMHHVIPRVLGGTKMLPLCNKHHAIIHCLKNTSSSSLIKKGIQKAKEAGVTMGRPTYLNHELINQLAKEGKSYREIGKILNCSHAGVYRVMRKLKDKKILNCKSYQLED